MKTCPKCTVEKPINEFYKHKGGHMGLRAQCKRCVDARNNERYRTVLSQQPEFMERNRTRGMAWYNANKERSHLRIAKTHKEQRLTCINHYGPACACCGETTYEFLAIDHIDGGGEKQRKTGISKICRWLIKNSFPSGFRVLCHNCNQAMGHYGYCPHHIKVSASDM